MSKKIIDYNENVKRTQIGKKNRRGRRGNYTPIYISLVLIIAAVSALLSLTVFFRIKQFDISGTDMYSEEQITEATGLAGDENLIRLNKSEVEERLESKLLYIEKAKVTAQYPATLKIEITQAKAFAAVESENGCYVVSDSGKILEKTESTSVPSGLVKLIGANIPEKTLEEYAESMTIPKIGFSDSRTEQAYFELMENLQLRGIKNITRIDIKDYLSISFVIDNRIRVNVGSSVDIPYKMQFVEKILQEKEGETRFLLINVGSTEKATVRTVTTYEELWQ